MQFPRHRPPPPHHCVAYRVDAGEKKKKKVDKYTANCERRSSYPAPVQITSVMRALSLVWRRSKERLSSRPIRAVTHRLCRVRLRRYGAAVGRARRFLLLRAISPLRVAAVITLQRATLVGEPFILLCEETLVRAIVAATTAAIEGPRSGLRNVAIDAADSATLAALLGRARICTGTRRRRIRL